MARMSLMKEFCIFLKDYKLWWILPIVVVLLLLSAFILIAESRAVILFIYTVY